MIRFKSYRTVSVVVTVILSCFLAARAQQVPSTQQKTTDRPPGQRKSRFHLLPRSFRQRLQLMSPIGSALKTSCRSRSGMSRSFPCRWWFAPMG